MADPKAIADLLASVAQDKAQGKKPIQHLQMDPVTVEGKAFCPTCGNTMPQQGLPEPYPIKDDENK